MGIGSSEPSIRSMSFKRSLNLRKRNEMPFCCMSQISECFQRAGLWRSECHEWIECHTAAALLCAASSRWIKKLDSLIQSGVNKDEVALFHITSLSIFQKPRVIEK